MVKSKNDKGDSELTPCHLSSVDHPPAVTTKTTVNITNTGATTVNDLALSPQCLPCQQVNIQFPVTNFSGKASSFNPEWFEEFKRSQR